MKNTSLYESGSYMCSKHATHSRLNGQNDWGYLYDHLMSMRLFTLLMDKIFIWAFNNYRAKGYGHKSDLLIIPQLCTCFISYKKWCREKSIQITHAWLSWQSPDCLLSVAQFTACFSVTFLSMPCAQRHSQKHTWLLLEVAWTIDKGLVVNAKVTVSLKGAAEGNNLARFVKWRNFAVSTRQEH